jgi:DNA polymerase-3 subunit epsilon
VRVLGIFFSFHRALADAQMTAQLWLKILDDLEEDYALGRVPFELLQAIGRTPKAGIARFLRDQVKA